MGLLCWVLVVGLIYYAVLGGKDRITVKLLDLYTGREGLDHCAGL